MQIYDITRSVISMLSDIVSLLRFRKDKQMLRVTSCICVNADFISDHIYLELIIHNDSKHHVMISGCDIDFSFRRGVTCDIDDFGTFGGYTIPTRLPKVLAPFSSGRVIFQFERTKEFLDYLNRIKRRDKRIKVYIYNSLKNQFVKSHVDFAKGKTWLWNFFDRQADSKQRALEHTTVQCFHFEQHKKEEGCNAKRT